MLLNKNSDFSTLMLIPESLQKVSMNKRCVRDRDDEICIPLIIPFAFASLINKPSPSMMRMNRRGDKG